MEVRRALPLLLFGLCHAGSGILCAADPPAAPGLKKARLNVAASESLFASVKQGDAIASMTIWIEQIGRVRGFQVEGKMEIAPIGQLRQSLKAHSVDLLVLDTPDYLSLSETNAIEVVAAGTSRGQLSALPYLLLTNDAAGATPTAGLRGKRIVVASRTKSNLGLVWLETLLAESRLGRVSAFFGSVDITYRASSCVLGLFFGKVDACVVDSGNWESLKELNPQLGRLRVVARSEPLVEGLIAMPVQPHPYRTEVIDSLLNLHKTPAGEQLGVVFKTGPLVRAGREQFESVRALYARYRRLVDSSGNVPVSGAGRPEESNGKERN